MNRAYRLILAALVVLGLSLSASPAKAYSSGINVVDSATATFVAGNPFTATIGRWYEISLWPAAGSATRLELNIAAANSSAGGWAATSSYWISTSGGASSYTCTWITNWRIRCDAAPGHVLYAVAIVTQATYSFSPGTVIGRDPSVYTRGYSVV